MRSQLMYIEQKDSENTARIARCTLSKTGRTVYYRGASLQVAKGGGISGNYFEVDSGTEYWVSRPRRDGRDRLFPGLIEVDDDAREEYWILVRGLPDRVGDASFRSEGKRER